ncbi:hypothetical protein MTR67_039918 [Solanum verrucosum]|uniref:Ribosomal protein S19 n=1 Tax=Solanum verrucosum TaxID=315347 RepID=A0AAF0ZQW4_SOLVR|nr:hypothetical protein MTR67_039918 [Solanum verrucosum]
MPRRSIWKGSFVDAFLLRMKKKRDLLFNRKIWSRRSSISPKFVDCSVRIYNGKTPVCCKITEGKAEKPGQPLPYVPITSASRAPATSSAREVYPDLRSANSVRIDFIQECHRLGNQ